MSHKDDDIMFIPTEENSLWKTYLFYKLSLFLNEEHKLLMVIKLFNLKCKNDQTVVSFRTTQVRLLLSAVNYY